MATEPHAPGDTSFTSAAVMAHLDALDRRDCETAEDTSTVPPPTGTAA